MVASFGVSTRGARKVRGIVRRGHGVRGVMPGVREASRARMVRGPHAVCLLHAEKADDWLFRFLAQVSDWLFRFLLGRAWFPIGGVSAVSDWGSGF